jgi:DNA-binding IclR family transcriptional regulator
MLDKAAALLNCFAPDDGPYRLSELARRAGLPKTTAHRLVGQLERLGLLERAGDWSDSGYRLGARLFELGSLVPRRLDLRETALAFLQDLHAAAGEAVHLGVRDDRSAVCLEHVPGHAGLPMPFRTGGRLPLTCTAVGKALLAFSDPGLGERILAAPLPRLTDHSITDPARLRTELEQAQTTGLAYAEQESALGVSCIAAPVFDRRGEAVAALSVAVPCARFRPAILAPALRTAALGLSRRLRGA